MADVEVVVKIPENTYRLIKGLAIQGYFEHDICGSQMYKIANGTVIPKGHGRIIDEDQITKCEPADIIVKDKKVIQHMATNAPTIIEKSKRKSEVKDKDDKDFEESEEDMER